jgi:DNA helicase-2/ATP-dependent DNA helicase PcrA
MNINFTPSRYQWNIFAFVQNGSGHGVIQGVAGCGKTTTNEMAGNLLVPLHQRDPLFSLGYFAFNRHIKVAMQDRVPPFAQVATFHSLGLGNIRRAIPGVEVEKDKLKHIMANHQTNGYDGSVKRLVSLCKANLLEPTPHNLDYISDRWDVDVDDGNREQVFDLAATVYHESIRQTSVVDFDDMIHFPAMGKVGCEQFDFLFVDEAQDLNKAQIRLALRSIKADGRILASGDAMQSLYGFRGADTDAIPNIIEALGATTLPLSICYRCPLKHVKQAQQLVPQIEAREGAPEGVLDDIPQGKLAEMVQPSDMVLCRCNAPLVPPALNLIRQGIKAVIIGRDVGKGLMALLRKVQKATGAFSLDETLWELETYADREVAKLYQTDHAMKAQSLRDRVETILALSDGCLSIGDLQTKVNVVFSDDKQGAAFATVHKAKGLQADNVFILKPQLMPHPKASKAWQKAEEDHILYVAWTRAKQELHNVR